MWKEWFALLLLVTAVYGSLPSEFNTLPRNYNYTLRSATVLESNFVPTDVASIRDAQGNIYSCFVTGTPFTLRNVAYSPSVMNPFLVKMSSDLKVTFVRQYSNITATSCGNILLDKQEQFVYMEFDRIKIVKADVNSGMISLSWTSNGTISSWDIVDGDKLIVSHATTDLFTTVCGIDPFYALGIISMTSQSMLSYKCFPVMIGGLSQPLNITYDNGKVYLLGRFMNELELLNRVIQGPLWEEIAFVARIDWQANTTDFVSSLGFGFGAFSSVQFAKDFSTVTFAFRDDIGFRIFKYRLPPSAGQNPTLMFTSPYVFIGDGNVVSGSNIYVSNSPSVVLHRYLAGFDYDLALIPIENGLVSNLKTFPMQQTTFSLKVHSVLMHNNVRQVTLIIQTSDSSLLSGISNTVYFQIAFVTVELPIVPIVVPYASLVARFDNIEATFSNLVLNSTRASIIEGNITLNDISGVQIILTKDSEIVPVDASLSITLLESNLNLEYYNTPSTPAAFDVYMQSNSTTPTGQLVGNGYQITSNARINNAEICINIATSLPLKQSYYQTPAMASRASGSNRMIVEPTLAVMRRGNQFCTRVSTSSPVFILL